MALCSRLMLSHYLGLMVFGTTAKLWPETFCQPSNPRPRKSYVISELSWLSTTTCPIGVDIDFFAVLGVLCWCTNAAAAITIPTVGTRTLPQVGPLQYSSKGGNGGKSAWSHWVAFTKYIMGTNKPTEPECSVEKSSIGMAPLTLSVVESLYWWWVFSHISLHSAVAVRASTSAWLTSFAKCN